MDKINEVVILGGGSSIKKAFSIGLRTLLSDRFCIGCNYSFRHFPLTFLTFGDYNFYAPQHLKKPPIKNPDIYEELKSLPLIIGMDKKEKLREIIHPNTILLKNVSSLNKIQSAKEGFYTKNMLTGVFSLSLACFLLNYTGKIFLMGFDFNSQGDTHYYSKEEIDHRGQGWHGCYSSHNPNTIFNGYLKFNELKIYNVSPESNITTFEKIDYPKFYELLSNEEVNQEDLRKDIKQKLL